MRKLPQLVAALATTFALTGAQAQALEEIKVSYQPALYWALPFAIATEKSWWAELGLKPAAGWSARGGAGYYFCHAHYFSLHTDPFP